MSLALFSSLMVTPFVEPNGERNSEAFCASPLKLTNTSMHSLIDLPDDSMSLDTIAAVEPGSTACSKTKKVLSLGKPRWQF